MRTLIVFLLVFIPLCFALDDFALVWDEGMTLERIDRMTAGWREYRAGRLSFADWLDRDWRFSRAEPDGHSPVYALVSWAGHVATQGWLTPPASYRMGDAFLFSVAVTAVFRTLHQYWGGLAPWLACGLLASTPRLVPEVCFALVDGPLLSLALLSWCCFVWMMDRPTSWLAMMCFGGSLGLAMGTKFTGWLLPLPFILATLIELLIDYRWSRPFRLAGAGVVAATVVLAVNLGWWVDPVSGIRGYFESNLTRRDTIPIPSMFLGETYPFALPWYNTVVWTVVAMPAGTAFLGLAGAVVALGQSVRDRLSRSILLVWLLIMVVRALPQAPGHDGTRQLVICLAFLSLLAGVLLHRFESLASGWWGRAPAAALVGTIGLLAVAESVFSTAAYHPHELSYYSPVVGGLPGAASAGFEPTYYWDSVTPEVLDWINEHTPADRWVLFRNYTPSFSYLHQWGKLVPTVMPRRDPPAWVVMQHRPGLMTAEDRALIEDAQPAFEKSLFGVPILTIYSFEDWRRVHRPGGDSSP